MEKVARFRLFRSRAFWFGVPGLVFLLWAWADSVKTKTTCSGGNHLGVYLVQEENYLLLQFTRSAATHGVATLSWNSKRESRSTPNSWPRWIYWPQHRHFEDTGGWSASVVTTPAVIDQLILPHWFVVLLYVLPWWSVVAGRWWRFRASIPVPEV